MVMPMAGRLVAAVIGGLLVLAAWASVTGTLIVSRSVSGWLTRLVDRIVNGVFGLAAAAIPEYQRRDRLLANQPAAILLTQLAAWLGISYIGFALVLWPFATRGVASAFTDAGSSLFTLGFAEPSGAVPAVIVFLASATGLVIVTLQIAYLPTLYSAFNRRETEVALLNARAGVPSWGPELLARTHYALGSGMSTLDTMPDLYAQWERWAADIAESHTTYLPLVRFRSPLPLSSWVTALLAVLDSAALFLALSPGAAPVVPARLCLRGGFLCFGRIARAMGFRVPEEPDPEGGISLTYEEFLERGRPDARGRLPDRARPRRGMDGLRRLAGHLRAGGLRGGLRRRRRARQMVGPTPASHRGHPALPPVARPPARVGTSDGRRAGNRSPGPGGPCLWAELTEQFTQRFGDQGRVRQRREVVTRPFGHGPAEFPCLCRLVLVGLAQLQVSGGGSGPPRHRRVNFLEHGQWQPGAAGREIPPRGWIRNQLGQGLVAPPLRPGRQPALVVSHLPQLGG